MQAPTWARTPLFDGLDGAALEDIVSQMQPRRFAAREIICRQGEAGGSLFIIQTGLAQVTVSQPGGERTVARIRRGEIVGELSLITGEARSATVVANVPTEVLELRRDAFAALLARHPSMLTNLNRILAQRLARRHHIPSDGRRGEAAALVTSSEWGSLAEAVVSAAKSASPGNVAALDLAGVLPASKIIHCEPSAEGVLSALDDLLVSHSTVIVVVDAGNPELPLLLAHMDRIVLLATEEEAWRAADMLKTAADRTELALLAPGIDSKAMHPATRAGFRVVRQIDQAASAHARDAAWLGRHLSRTKLGLALGAGGAKGYAHIGVLQVLEEAGYTVDFVSGSSIGAMVGAWLALGSNAAEIDAIMRSAFAPENVAAMFKLSLSGTSSGLDVHTRVCQETTRGKTFADLVIPLVAMAVDMNSRQPAPMRDGPLWQALLASTALAGMFPPFVRDGQRLVDGLALVPVPTDAVVEAGADITLSVNIMSREALPAWPGQLECAAPPARSGSRMLDTLLEVMDLSHLDSSVRHAAKADVVVTPRFGPGTWRDFHLADLFLTAGRAAALEQLPLLRTLARPASNSTADSTDDTNE
jgi:NTE family protein